MHVYLYSLCLLLLGAPADLPSAKLLQQGLPERISALTKNFHEPQAKLAVLVYPDAKAAGKLDLDDWSKDLATLISQKLKTAGYVPVLNEELTELAEERGRAGTLRPIDVQQFQKVAQVDAALVAVYGIQGDNLGLRLTLISEEKVVARGKLGTTPVTYVTGNGKPKPKLIAMNPMMQGSGVSGYSRTGGYGVSSLTPCSLVAGTNLLTSGSNDGLSDLLEYAEEKSNSGSTEKPGQGGSPKPKDKTPATDPVDPDKEVPLDTTPPKVSELNQKVLNYAIENLGRQVGNGECWTLAAEALKAAGAHHPQTYVFGDVVDDVDDIVPGDILQFSNAKYETANSTIWMGAPNHTAVVYKIRGSEVTVLHQNFSNNRNVTTLTFDLDTLASGTCIAYRPTSR